MIRSTSPLRERLSGGRTEGGREGERQEEGSAREIVGERRY